MRLIPYHTRLALKSLRRDPGLSVTIVIVLAVAAAMFSTAIMHYLRIYGPPEPLSPALHQVEIAVGERALERAFSGSSAAPSRLASRTRVSFPNYQILASSGIPPRQAASLRARLLVGRRQEDVDVAGASGSSGAGTTAGAVAPARPRNARFVNADFFAMFGRAFRWGAPWSRDDEARGRSRVVISRSFNEQTFAGGDSVGKIVMIDARPFQVAGVLADQQPFSPEWDPAASGGGQDAVYLPFPAHDALMAWPETPLYVAPIGPGRAELFASGTIFISFWVELPTAASRQAYARFLDQRLGRRGVAYQLRDLAAWRAALRFPPSAISFFTLLTLIMLAGAGLIVTRLLLVKGLVRGDELGVFRALGAPRRALFWRQLIEATILSGIAALLSLGMALLQARFHNRFVIDTDIPLGVTGLSALITAGATLVVGLVAALYPGWRAAAQRPTLVLGRS